MKPQSDRPSQAHKTDRAKGIRSIPGSGSVSAQEPAAAELGDALMTAANSLVQVSETIDALSGSSTECEAFSGATLRRELGCSCDDLIRRLSPLLGQFAARTVRPSAELQCWDERRDDDIPF